MASLYTENSEKWKALVSCASIDYIEYFRKAWIAFNSWYENHYSSRTDRQCLDKVKSISNDFRNNFISLLKRSDNEGVSFKSRIAELHLQLQQTPIIHKNQCISFESIVIEDNPINKPNFPKYRGITYIVEKGMPNRKGEIDIIVLNQKGNKIFNYTQINGFNLQDLTSHHKYLKLSNTQQKMLETCYKEINPKKPISLLTNDKKNFIIMGNIKFIKDEEKLYKGTIEILYKLRNISFHGQITLDCNASDVYESAYHILYPLVQAL